MLAKSYLKSRLVLMGEGEPNINQDENTRVSKVFEKIASEFVALDLMGKALNGDRTVIISKEHAQRLELNMSGTPERESAAIIDEIERNAIDPGLN